MITVRLNAFTDKATAYEYFHRRAKDIADQNGYERYDVLELLDPDERGYLYWGSQIQPVRYPRLQGRVKYYRKQVSQPPNNAPSTKRPAAISRGTGWPVKEGFVVTNSHVLGENNHALLFRTDGSKMPATVVLRDEVNDLVLLKVQNTKKLPPALPLSSAPAKMGAAVFTIGYPLSSVMGNSPKLAEGTINSVTGLDDNPRTLQVSVPIQPGNSGGPLFNMNGEVVGIIFSTLNPLYTLERHEALPQAVNYAIKVGYLKPLIESISPQGTIPVLPIGNRTLEELAGQLQGSILIVETGPAEEIPVPQGPTSPSAPDNPPVPPDLSVLQVFENLTASLHEYQTYMSAELDSTRLSTVASFFNVPQGAVVSFRWGKSMAGKGDPLAGTAFYTLKYRAGDSVLTRVIDVDAQGNIIGTEDK